MLQVLCVFLDSSCGLKSDSSAVKGMAIDILGVIASKLKMDQRSIEKEIVPLVKGLCKPLGDDSSAICSVEHKEEQVNDSDTAGPGSVKEGPLCTSNGTAVVPTGSEALARIFTRFNDEEASVRDLVLKTFHDVWFEGAASTTAVANTDGSAAVPGIWGSSKVSQEESEEQKVPAIAGQLVEAQEGESDEFAALPFVMALQAFCEVDATLCTPPVDPSRFATTLLPYLTTTQDDRSNGDVKPRERLARLACLSESIVRVIAGILAHLRRPPSSLVTDLDQVLACLIISSSFMNLVHVSIRCLCTLQIVSPRPLKSFQLLVPRFYRALTNPNESKFHWRSLFALGLLCRYGGNEIEALEPSLPIPSILTVFKSFLSSPEEELQQRALQALGFAFIARPQEMVTEDAAQIFGNALHMEAPSKHKVQVLRSFQEYLTDVEEKMVEQNRRNLQTEAAAKKAQDAARHQSTGELQEESAEGIGAGGSSSATGVVPVAAGAGDTNVCSGVIQQHWEAILQCCMDMDPDVRQTALKLVEIVLNQGLVLPVTCVPQLIALQVDPDETTWKTSHHLLSLINDRWGNYRFIENRFTDGMRLAYGFMRALSGHPTNTQSNPAIKTPTKADPNSPRTTSSPATHAASAKLLGLAREGLGRVYKLIRGNRSSRNNILLSILRKFDCVDASSSMSNKLGSSTPTNSPSTSRAHQEPPSSYSVTPSGAFDIYFLAFCAQVIATFPFALPDEPLFLVHHISRVAHMRGGSLHSSIKYLFRPSSPLGPSVTSAVKAIEEEQAARCGNAYRITEEEEDDEEAGGSQPIEITIPEGASCCGNDQQEQQAFLDGALRRLKVSWEMASWYLEGRVTRVFDT
ncbi:unnamed protein product [Closterium sp. NIES-64]|nr:unnamed protein product [Closterium sp. NIES-64]